MAGIEPIGSAMTFQAQQIQQPRQVTNPETVDTEVKDGQNGSTVAFDPTTAKIQEVKDQDPNSSGDSTNGSMYEQQKEASQEQLKKVAENINKNMSNSEAVFGIHEGTNRVTIKIVDKSTKEVIKELPPEKTLDMIAKAWELAGLMVDEKR